MESSQHNKNLQPILKMFQHYGCQKNSLLAKPSLIEILDKQSLNNSKRKFDPAIIEQIWGQAETLSKGESTVMIFSKILAEAMSILEDRIKALDDDRKGIPFWKGELEKKKKELQNFEAQYQEGFEDNYAKINAARKNISVVETKIRELEGNKRVFSDELFMLTNCLKIKDRVVAVEETQYIQEHHPVEDILEENAPQLKTIFTITLIAACIELLILGYRPSFFSLLALLLIIYWLFYGYYNHHFVKLLMASLCVSCTFDFTYLLLQILSKIGTVRYSESKILLIFTMIFMMGQIALKIFLTALLCRYREPPLTKEYFQLLGIKIHLRIRSGKHWDD